MCSARLLTAPFSGACDHKDVETVSGRGEIAHSGGSKSRDRGKVVTRSAGWYALLADRDKAQGAFRSPRRLAMSYRKVVLSVVSCAMFASLAVTTAAQQSTPPSATAAPRPAGAGPLEDRRP